MILSRQLDWAVMLVSLILVRVDVVSMLAATNTSWMVEKLRRSGIFIDPFVLQLRDA